jgi:hypothetical protein
MQNPINKGSSIELKLANMNSDIFPDPSNTKWKIGSSAYRKLKKPVTCL